MDALGGEVCMALVFLARALSVAFLFNLQLLSLPKRKTRAEAGGWSRPNSKKMAAALREGRMLAEAGGWKVAASDRHPRASASSHPEHRLAQTWQRVKNDFGPALSFSSRAPLSLKTFTLGTQTKQKVVCRREWQTPNCPTAADKRSSVV